MSFFVFLGYLFLTPFIPGSVSSIKHIFRFLFWSPCDTNPVYLVSITPYLPLLSIPVRFRLKNSRPGAAAFSPVHHAQASIGPSQRHSPQHRPPLPYGPSDARRCTSSPSDPPPVTSLRKPSNRARLDKPRGGVAPGHSLSSSELCRHGGYYWVCRVAYTGTSYLPTSIPPPFWGPLTRTFETGAGGVRIGNAGHKGLYAMSLWRFLVVCGRTG